MTLETNLEHYYKLNGNSNDNKSTNNGTDANVTYSLSNGKIDQGAGFGGTNSKISFSNDAGWKPTGAFTVAAWIKSSSATDQMIAESYQQNGNPAGWQFYLSSTGKIGLLSGKNTGLSQGTDYQLVQGSTSVANGSFRFAVATWDTTKLHVYADATEDATAVNWANAPAYAGTNSVRLGVNEYITGSSTNNWFNGAIDEFAIWSRALSGAEITQLYNSGKGMYYNGSIFVPPDVEGGFYYMSN